MKQPNRCISGMPRARRRRVIPPSTPLAILLTSTLTNGRLRPRTSSYPFIASFTDDTCTARPVESWEVSSSTLEECCRTSFGPMADNCLEKGLRFLKQSNDGVVSNDNHGYIPDWSSRTCTNDSPPLNEWIITYPTLKACCTSNFEWTMTSCLGHVATNRNDLPTRPPAMDTTLSVLPVDLSPYYYPRYTQNVCLLDGTEAPTYMKADPMTYLAQTPEECCRVQFPLTSDECLGKSDSSVTPVVTVTADAKKWNGLYYPVFSKLRCTNDENSPQFMKDGPDGFFRTTVELCCEHNFSFDYDICVEGSVDVHSKEKDPVHGPVIVLSFGGRLYFRNVFIPTGTRENMIVVRDVVLSSVRTTLEDGSNVTVESLVGKNFDGVDLSSLRRRLFERDLARIQVFSFHVQVSVECGASCGRDGAAYGRGLSLELVREFNVASRGGDILDGIKTSMEDKGLIGPFQSASLDDGALLYEEATVDMRGFTFGPTLEPSSLPSWAPSLVPPPTNRPTLSLGPSVTRSYKFYPNYMTGTCVANSQYSEFEVNFYDTLEECCEFPWLIKEDCLRIALKPPTTAPQTRKPTAAPTAHPTATPTTGKSSKPSSPTTMLPSKRPSTHSVSTKPSVGAVKTSSPTAKPSTSSQTCAKGWHISLEIGGTCTNSDNILPEWHTAMYFKTGLECCKKHMGGECNMIDACPGITPASTAKPTAAPSHLNPSGENGCSNPWHVSTTGDSHTCTNDKTYPSAWDNENIRHKHLLDTPESCCERFFGGKECRQVNVCDSATTTTTSSTKANEGSTSAPAGTDKTTSLDWEDKIIPLDLVRFEGIGRWIIDDSQPCCKAGVAIHNPSLLPGEYSSMIIEYDIPPGGGRLSFTYINGMGKFSFYINDLSIIDVSVPGGGLKTYQTNLLAGAYKFTWRYDAPTKPNLPLSNVWVDNIVVSVN